MREIKANRYCFMKDISRKPLAIPCDNLRHQIKLLPLYFPFFQSLPRNRRSGFRSESARLLSNRGMHRTVHLRPFREIEQPLIQMIRHDEGNFKQKREQRTTSSSCSVQPSGNVCNTMRWRGVGFAFLL